MKTQLRKCWEADFSWDLLPKNIIEVNHILTARSIIYIFTANAVITGLLPINAKLVPSILSTRRNPRKIVYGPINSIVFPIIGFATEF